ncbi:PEPxxWA-CTERM sorting domain-containing protein [Altererythrobacter sediminis]|uniref:PEPxxWA-CTERM sorting domain-containing protein n=1 Tax=Allopontixanthobacter sediminis TaxID=1689985 RepID=A0A845B4Y5_9SPHN|nr:PEPxxWA-CTERM sorting domain-containing protein [Allopontixanthobacter sediminis]MXP44592.1 PEPxxWA-CTERM sorting domain-containing protein [Allopontixanthobacter sediminis]
MKSLLLIASALCLSNLAPESAQAATILDNVTCAEVGPGAFSCNQASAVVGVGDEFNISGFFGIDFSSGILSIRALSSGLLGGTVLQFQNLTNPWTSANLLSGSVGNFDSSDVTLTSGILRVDFSNTGTGLVGPFAAGDTFTIGLVQSAVPEPETWALMLLGFGLVGGAMRSRRKKAVSPSFA